MSVIFIEAPVSALPWCLSDFILHMLVFYYFSCTVQETVNFLNKWINKRSSEHWHNLAAGPTTDLAEPTDRSAVCSDSAAASEYWNISSETRASHRCTADMHALVHSRRSHHAPATHDNMPHARLTSDWLQMLKLKTIIKNNKHTLYK